MNNDLDGGIGSAILASSLERHREEWEELRRLFKLAAEEAGVPEHEFSVSFTVPDYEPPEMIRLMAEASARSTNKILWDVIIGADA
jgi:hypothetical protein